MRSLLLPTTFKGTSPPTSGPTVRREGLPVEKKIRPGSIVVSGNKKNDDPPTPKPDVPDPDVLGVNVFIPHRPSGERGRQFYRIFLYKLFPFHRLMSINSNYAISRVEFFLQMPMLSDRQVPLAVWVAQPAKKRRVGSDLLARRQWSSSLNQVVAKN